MVGNFYEMQEHQDDKVLENSKYRNLMGSLLYRSNRTRPDISTAVAILATRVVNPTAFLMKTAQCVLIYLRGSSRKELVHSKSKGVSSPNLIFFVDSDYSGEKLDRKSRTGSIGMVNGCSRTLMQLCFSGHLELDV